MAVSEKVPSEAHVQPQAMDEGSVQYLIDPEEEKRVIWKIDRAIMPLMFATFFFQFLDKQTINYAAIFGMQTEIHVSGNDFSWAVSLFYFGQLASQFMSAYFIGRFRVATVVSIAIILWGVCEMCHGAPANASGLLAVRFFLGFCEGIASPGFVILTSNWYKRKEHPIRVAIWQGTNGFAQIIGAILMYLIGHSSSMAIASWRVMFLICGGFTILSGGIFFWLMPTDTTTAWFLNERERQIATERLAMDRGTRDKAQFNKDQAKEGILDPHTWILFCIALFICIPSPILKFSSLVISGFGFSNFKTMLVGLPSGAIQIITAWAAALAMHYTKKGRCICGIALTLIPLVGSIVLLTLPASHKWGIVVSTWLAAQSSSLMVVSLSLMASNVKGNTKKPTTNAIFFLGYSTGCIVGPQLWQAPDAPRYIKGCISSIVSWVLLIIFFGMYYILFRWENSKRGTLLLQQTEDETGHEASPEKLEKELHVGVDVNSDSTDRQDLKFMYTI